MKTIEEIIHFLQELSEKTESFQEKQLVDYGTDDEREDWVWAIRPTVDAMCAKRILVLLNLDKKS